MVWNFQRDMEAGHDEKKKEDEQPQEIIDTAYTVLGTMRNISLSCPTHAGTALNGRPSEQHKN